MAYNKSHCSDKNTILEAGVPGTVSLLVAVLSPFHSSPKVNHLGLVKPQITGVPEFLIQYFMWGDPESFCFYMFLGGADTCLGVTLRIPTDDCMWLYAGARVI